MPLDFQLARQDKLTKKNNVEYKSQVRLEADSLFPELKQEAESFFESSYYPDSFIFPWNPDPLVRGNDYSKYDEMKDDDQVKVAIAIKKDMVINTGWQIVCDNEEIKKAITENLENLYMETSLGNTFEDSLRDLLTSYEYGFSLAEPLYRLTDKGLYELKEIKVRPPHSFRFEIDPKGNVLRVVQYTNKGEISLEPKTILHHVYSQEFGNPFGKSDLRAAFPAWKIKKFFLRFFAIYVERFAQPTIVGKYPPNLDSDQIDKFEDVIKSIQNNTTLTVPEDTQVEFVQASRDASDVYIKGLDLFNLWIARAILVPDLLGIGGSKTTGGSFALGKEHFRLFMGTIRKDRESLSRKITQKVIKPLVLANWGDVPCRFEFKPFTEENTSEYLTLWIQAVNTKAFKPNPEEINHFRNLVKFPEGEVLEPTTQPVTPNPNQFSKDSKTFQKLGRELTSFEKKMDFTQIQEVLNKNEKRLQPELMAATKTIYNDLIDQFRNKNIIERFKPEKINELQPRFLKDANLVLKNNFKGLFRESIEQARKEIFPHGTKKFVEEEILPEEFLDILDAETFQLVGKYSTDVTARAKFLITKGLKDGLSQNEIVKHLKEQLQNVSDRWVTALVRTKTTEIYNSARKTFWDTDPLASQIIEAYEYSAILDERVSEVCRFLDSKIFVKGDFTDRITPPLHINCRSLLVPVTRFEDFEADREPGLDNLVEMGGHLILE